jgi:hypothetical protein
LIRRADIAELRCQLEKNLRIAREVCDASRRLKEQTLRLQEKLADTLASNCVSSRRTGDAALVREGRTRRANFRLELMPRVRPGGRIRVATDLQE